MPDLILSGGFASTGLCQLWSISTVGGGVFFLGGGGGGGTLRSGDAGDCADDLGLTTAYGSRISRTYFSQSKTSSQCTGDSPVYLAAPAGACRAIGRLIVFEMPELQPHQTPNEEPPAQPTVRRHTITHSQAPGSR